MTRFRHQNYTQTLGPSQPSQGMSMAECLVSGWGRSRLGFSAIEYSGDQLSRQLGANRIRVPAVIRPEADLNQSSNLTRLFSIFPSSSSPHVHDPLRLDDTLLHCKQTARASHFRNLPVSSARRFFVGVSSPTIVASLFPPERSLGRRRHETAQPSGCL